MLTRPSTPAYQALAESPDALREQDVQMGTPAPRVHHIEDLALPNTWDMREQLTIDYFNGLNADSDSFYTIPVAGDILFAHYGGETFVYRVSSDPSRFDGHKYDENTPGNNPVADGDVWSFRFTLVRSTMTFKFVARLVQYREGFWAKIASEGEGVFIIEEVEKFGNDWEVVAAGVNGVTAKEVDGSDAPEVGDVVYVTKTFDPAGLGYTYVFKHSVAGGGETDFWAEVIYADTDSIAYILQPKEMVHNGGNPGWDDAGDPVYAIHQARIRGVPVGTIVHVYKRKVWEDSSTALNPTDVWYVFELIHSSVDVTLKDLTADTPDANEEFWKLALGGGEARVGAGTGARFYLQRVEPYEGTLRIFRREVKIDTAGHIHFLSEEEEDDTFVGGGTVVEGEIPWELYLENYGTDEEPDWHIIYPFGSDLYQWGGGAQQRVPYTNNATHLGDPDDGDYTVQLKITTNSTGAVVISASTELVPGVNALPPVTTNYVATTTYIVVSTINVNGDDITIANHMSGRALGCLPVLTGGLVGMGVL